MEVITDMVLNGHVDRETISKSYLQGSGTNASLVELLKLKLQTVKHFLQAQGCVKKRKKVVCFWALGVYRGCSSIKMYVSFFAGLSAL